MPGRHAHGALVVALLAGLLFAAPSQAQRATTSPCRTIVPLTAVPDLREGSGVVWSRLAARVLAINDSDRPELAMLDERGQPLRRISVRNAVVGDWEDLTSGQCPDGPCVYIADIGDNQAARPTVTLFRLPEPRDNQTEVTATRFDVAYPDGPHDAEAMFAAPDGRLYLLTKQPRGAVLYAFPRTLQVTGVNRLERVRELSGGSGRTAFARITDAETTPDGRTVAVRSNDALFILPTNALLAGRLEGATVFALRALNEPQGEGVAFTGTGEVVLLGESGSRRNTGTFARLACEAPAP